MSIYSRLHKPTGYEFIDNAVELEREIYRFVRSEKNIPKRDWFTHGLPLLMLARDLNTQIAAIKSIFPSPKRREDFIHQREAIQLAIELNEKINKSIQMMVLEIDTIDCNKLDGIGERIEHESKLLRGLKSKVKIPDEE